MKINNKDYFTKFGEFYTTSYPGYENLSIKPEVGILERHIGLLKDINDELFALSSLCVIGDNYGGFVPINCANSFYNIFVYSNKINEEIKSSFQSYKNIEYSTEFYPCKFIYVHNLNLLTPNIIQQIKENDCIVLSKNTELFNFYEYKYTLTKKSTHEFDKYTLYIPSYLNDDFLSKFHYYFDKNSQLDYDNLIHLCIMVKDAGKLFEKVLTENLDVIDRWTVLDTGSTDGTQDVVKRILSNKKGGLYEEPFLNFRDSRNACLNFAGKNCKYTLMLDDTYVVQGDLRKFLNIVRGDQFANSYSLLVKSDDTEYYSNRVIKTEADLRYIYKIHEVIQKDNNVNVVIPNLESWILDYRADYMEKRTMDRKLYDLQLLFEEVEENPNDPRHYYYIAQTYNLLEQHEKAAEYFLKRAYHTEEGFLQEKVDSLFEVARIYNFKLNKPWEECEKMYLQTYEWEPSRPDALYFVGIHYFLENNVDEAYKYMKKAFDIGYPVHTQFSLKPTLSYYFIPKFLSQLAYKKNDFITGFSCCKLFLEKNTNTKDIEYDTIASFYRIFYHLNNFNTVKQNYQVNNLSQKDNIICFVVDGGYSDWTGKDILSKGMGGSETWAVETSRYIKKNFPSNRIVVFCKCNSKDTFEGVEYMPLDDLYLFLYTHKVSTCVVSRFTEYIPFIYHTNTQNIVLVLHDISPIGNVIPITNKLKQVVCLSEWHADNFKKSYPDLKDITTYHHYGIDKERFYRDDTMKKPYSFIYSSFPNRGLSVLLKMWDKIKKHIPQATLDIYSDVHGNWVTQNYPEEMKEITDYLWDKDGVEQYYNKGITYNKWVSKDKLAEAWRRADVWFYPCTFKETFCLTALEAASTGTLAITNNLAALRTTVGDRGLIVEGDVTTEEWQDKALQEIIRIFNNKEEKELLVNKNYEWANDYNWNNKAIEFYDKYISNYNETKDKYITSIDSINYGNTNLVNRFWFPNENVLSYLEDYTSNFENILELGPGVVPFKNANYIADKYELKFQDKSKTFIKMDIDKDRYNENDGMFEFGYARHIFEDITNPVFAFEEFARVCIKGYIETPSPLIEITRGVDATNIVDSNKYRGYLHHKYFVWTSLEDNTLHFLPKFPIVEHLDFDKDYEDKLRYVANNYEIYWNNYYYFGDDLPAKCILHEVYGHNFKEYKQLIMQGIDESIKSTNYFMEQINNTDDKKIINNLGMYNWTNDVPKNSRKIFEDVLNMFQEKKCDILEIGTYAGTSLIEMLKILPHANAVAVDIWKNYIEKNEYGNTITILNKMEDNKVEQIFYDNLEASGMKNRVQVFKGDSKDVLMTSLNDMRFDFIYVDGSHLCLDTYIDLVLAWKLLRVGGVMGIDDYLYNSNKENLFESPYEAVNHFMKKYERSYEIISKQYRVFLKKIK
jgi:predicted O-methyltransferase YrrM